MKKLFTATLAVSIVMAIGIALLDFFSPRFWGLGIGPYLWAVAGICVVAPASVIALLFPYSRRRVGVPRLFGNVVMVVLLVTLVNNSETVQIMMSV